MKRAGATVVCAAALFWFGCTPEKRYETLSIFFDGVPDPHAKTISASASGKSAPLASGQGPIASIHKPFAEEKCTACHAQSVEVSLVVDTNLCLTCHQKVMDAYPAMHGPVIGKACLWCHEPHQSPSPFLLKTTATSLCTQCHDRELLTQRTAGHTTDAGSCLDCHNGHGGHAIPFLRADATTRPADKPEKPAQ